MISKCTSCTAKGKIIIGTLRNTDKLHKIRFSFDSLIRPCLDSESIIFVQMKIIKARLGVMRKKDQHISDQLGKINESMRDYNFTNLIFFKGFSYEDQEDLQILITDNGSSDTYSDRIFDFEEKLETVLGEDIHITNEKDMYAHYKRQLNHTNSIELTALLGNESASAVFDTLKEISPTDFWKETSRADNTAVLFSHPNKELPSGEKITEEMPSLRT